MLSLHWTREWAWWLREWCVKCVNHSESKKSFTTLIDLLTTILSSPPISCCNATLAGTSACFECSLTCATSEKGVVIDARCDYITIRLTGCV